MADLLDNYDSIEAKYFRTPRKHTTRKPQDFLQKVHLSLSQLVYMLNNANKSISDLCFWHNKSYLSLFPAALFLCFLGRNHMADNINLTFLLSWYVKFFFFFLLSFFIYTTRINVRSWQAVKQFVHFQLLCKSANRKKTSYSKIF